MLRLGIIAGCHAVIGGAGERERWPRLLSQMIEDEYDTSVALTIETLRHMPYQWRMSALTDEPLDLVVLLVRNQRVFMDSVLFKRRKRPPGPPHTGAVAQPSRSRSFIRRHWSDSHVVQPLNRVLGVLAGRYRRAVKREITEATAANSMAEARSIPVVVAGPALSRGLLGRAMCRDIGRQLARAASGGGYAYIGVSRGWTAACFAQAGHDLSIAGHQHLAATLFDGLTPTLVSLLRRPSRPSVVPSETA